MIDAKNLVEWGSRGVFPPVVSAEDVGPLESFLTTLEVGCFSASLFAYTLAIPSLL